MSKQLFTTCPADCDEFVQLPAIPENQDCTAYDTKKAQICDLYLMPDGATNPLASWSTTPTAVAGAIDNTVTDNTKCKWLVGKGVVTSEEVRVAYPKGKSKISEIKYTLSFDVFDIANHYTFLTSLQCGDTSINFWYGDLADYIYGLSGGIVPEELFAKNTSGGGDEDTSKWTITVKWTGNADPQRRTNPL